MFTLTARQVSTALFNLKQQIWMGMHSLLLLKGTLTLQANFSPLMQLKIIRITVKTVCPNSFYIKRYLQKTKYLQWPWGSEKCYIGSEKRRIGSEKRRKRIREVLHLRILELLHQDPKSVTGSEKRYIGSEKRYIGSEKRYIGSEKCYMQRFSDPM